ncbi:MAG: hypothetical protein AAFQ80_11230 [Cyanobacteria bacterium J06621_8]
MIIEEQVILIRINQGYYDNISKEKLYEVTRGIWKINPQRASDVKYAFALFKGIIKEVYQVNQWHKAGTLKYLHRDSSSFADSNRWEFEGRIANREIRSKYIGESLKDYFSKGSQNPIKYVNC